jgi:hypothetical protein
MIRRRRQTGISPERAQFRAEQAARIVQARADCVEALRFVEDPEVAVNLLATIEHLDQALQQYAPGFAPPGNPDPALPDRTEA